MLYAQEPWLPFKNVFCCSSSWMKSLPLAHLSGPLKDLRPPASSFGMRHTVVKQSILNLRTDESL